MSYQAIQTVEQDLFFIDPDLLRMILHNAAWEEAKRDHSDEKDGFYVTDYTKVRARAQHARHIAKALAEQRSAPTSAFFTALGSSISKSSQLPSTVDLLELREFLFERERSGRRATEQHLKRWNAFHNGKVQDARDSAKNWGKALSVATFVRDAAIEVYSVVPITAPIGVLAKGAAVYQDTGDLGAASAKLGTEITLIVVPKAIRNKAVAYVVGKATEFGGDTAVGYLSDPGAGLTSAALGAGTSSALSVGFDGLGRKLGLDDLAHAKVLNETEMSSLFRTMTADDIKIPVGLSMVKTNEGVIKSHSANQVVGFLNGRNRKFLKKATVSHPVMADLAILGPNKSHFGRHWQNQT